MPSILHYEFMVRALLGGAIVGVLAPSLGMFLVLRRFSLIADTLSHVALMGVAVGLATSSNPAIVALAAATLGAVVIEWLSAHQRLPGDVALAVVLYAALAAREGYRVGVISHGSLPNAYRHEGHVFLRQAERLYGLSTSPIVSRVLSDLSLGLEIRNLPVSADPVVQIVFPDRRLAVSRNPNRWLAELERDREAANERDNSKSARDLDAANLEREAEEEQEGQAESTSSGCWREEERRKEGKGEGEKVRSRRRLRRHGRCGCRTWRRSPRRGS